MKVDRSKMTDRINDGGCHNKTMKLENEEAEEEAEEEEAAEAEEEKEKDYYFGKKSSILQRCSRCYVNCSSFLQSVSN